MIEGHFILTEADTLLRLLVQVRLGADQVNVAKSAAFTFR